MSSKRLKMLSEIHDDIHVVSVGVEDIEFEHCAARARRSEKRKTSSTRRRLNKMIVQRGLDEYASRL